MERRKDRESVREMERERERENGCVLTLTTSSEHPALSRLITSKPLVGFSW